MSIPPILFGARKGQAWWINRGQQAANAPLRPGEVLAEIYMQPTDQYLTLEPDTFSGTQLLAFLKARHPEVEVTQRQESVSIKGPATQNKRFGIQKRYLGHPLSDNQWAFLVTNHLGGGTPDEWKTDILNYLSEQHQEE